jgi:hypothetical protein
MKADREFATPEEAKAEILKWIEGEHRVYERFLAPSGLK